MGDLMKNIASCKSSETFLVSANDAVWWRINIIYQRVYTALLAAFHASSAHEMPPQSMRTVSLLISHRPASHCSALIKQLQLICELWQLYGDFFLNNSTIILTVKSGTARMRWRLRRPSFTLWSLLRMFRLRLRILLFFFWRVRNSGGRLKRLSDCTVSWLWIQPARPQLSRGRSPSHVDLIRGEGGSVSP